MARIQALSIQERAAFAVTSRLLSSLIAESQLQALYLPLEPLEASAEAGVCIVLSKQASVPPPSVKTCYDPNDIFVLILLRSTPVFKPRKSDVVSSQKEIALVDPLDMLPVIYEVQGGDSILVEDVLSKLLRNTSITQNGVVFTSRLVLSLDPVHLWRKFSSQLQVEHTIDHTILQELQSSLDWQKYTYENPPSRPTFGSSRIEWEQSLVEGHPTHPMHRARRMVSPLPSMKPGQYDFFNPYIRFMAVPRNDIIIQEDFEELLLPLLEAATNTAGRGFDVQESYIVLPVHEMQIPNIVEKFQAAVIFPEEYRVPARAQACIRTVTLTCCPSISLKLPIGMKISSALRTISHYTAYSGPKFSRDIVPLLSSIDPKVLVLEKEIASAVHRHRDPDFAKHCSAVIRDLYNAELYHENVIVATALVEFNYGDMQGQVPNVVTAFGLDTEDQKFDFLSKYVNTIFDAFIPPMVNHGLAFEAHGQNTLVRFDKTTKELKGFIYRDFGGLGIHQPTLYASIGRTVDALPSHTIIVEQLRDAHKILYHTLIHCHLQRLIRVLGFHHNGRGWKLVKKALEARIPRENALWESWLDPQNVTVFGKSLIRMKLEDLYRDFLYDPVPNLIHYEV